MHYAVFRNHEKAVGWLIDAGVPIDKVSKAGQHSPLIIAAHFGYASLVSKLLQAGAQPLPLDKVGLTSLHHAAASSSIETVERLLQAGASLTYAQAIKNRDNSTPLSIAARVAATANGARQAQSGAVLKRLEAESKELKRWFRAARVVDMETLTTHRFGSSAAYCNVADGSGMTALFSCVRACRVDAVRWMLDHGAKVGHVDKSGMTALHHFAEVCGERPHGARDVLRELLGHKPPVVAIVAASKSITETANRLMTSAERESISHEQRVTTTATVTKLLELMQDVRAVLVKVINMKKWKNAARVAGKLMVLHARAVERAYAPGGRGFEEAKDDFEERASKVRRIE